MFLCRFLSSSSRAPCCNPRLAFLSLAPAPPRHHAPSPRGRCARVLSLYPEDAALWSTHCDDEAAARRRDRADERTEEVGTQE
eukprot:3804450-Pleurochrysis_carterae.AAC.1